MTKKGSELEFISQINRDGKGVTTNLDVGYLDDTIFPLITLSLTRKTYIAIDMNMYVVKIKAK